MYRVPCKPATTLCIAENKTLACKEDRSYEGEALGRKVAVVFFETIDGGLVRRVNRDTLTMKQELLPIAEILHTIRGAAIHDDPERTAAHTELILEKTIRTLGGCAI